jgi:hypothetical protein
MAKAGAQAEGLGFFLGMNARLMAQTPRRMTAILDAGFDVLTAFPTRDKE